MKVLVLGGTSEAREIAELLAIAPDAEVVVSLAGHTSQPTVLPYAVRVGGFGGVEALVDYLHATSTDVLIDATHPFAAMMSANAAKATATIGIPALRVLRPPWTRQPGDNWIGAKDLQHACTRVIELGVAKVLLTIGRLDLEPFRALDVHFVIRSIEKPDRRGFARTTVIQARGPFDVDAELALLHTHAIDCVVTKNSGGATAKLDAARRSGVPVVMIRRPPAAIGATVATAPAAIAWLAAQRVEAQ